MTRIHTTGWKRWSGWRRLGPAGVALVLLFPTAGSGQVIPAERCFTNAWRAAGYDGEIPAPARIVNVKDYGALGNGTASDSAAVNAAITAVSAGGGVVFFPAGAYFLPAAVNVSSGVVLRGERSFNTTLIFSNIWHCINIAKAQSAAFQPLVSGYDLHSSNVVVTNAGIFQAGDYAEISESNDPAWSANDWASVGQIVRISAVSADTLTLQYPLRLQYQAGLNPSIRKIDPVAEAGVENLRIQRVPTGTATDRNNAFTIDFYYAARCWVRGVECTNGFGGDVGTEYSTQIEVTGCYLHHPYEVDGGGSGYGVRLELRSGQCLAENTIFQRNRHAMLLQAGANGNVFGYNYAREATRTEFPAEVSADAVCHGNYPYANLFEGNICQHISLDNSHGVNGPYNTYVRNRAERYGIWMTQSSSHNQNFVGNETFAGFWGGGYVLAATGHFAYANNTDSGVQPAGTTNLPDYSYYLNNNPTQSPLPQLFWNITNAMPTIGLPLARSPAKTNPAYNRYFAGGRMTVGPPSIWGQPTNQNVAAGQAAVFTVAATGTPVALYQWYKDGAPLTGQTNASLQIAAAQSSDAGTYQALVTDDNGFMRSAVAALTVQVTTVSLVTAGNPERYGNPQPFGYGTQTVMSASVITNTVTAPIEPAPGTQYVCTGWSGTGSVPSNGSSNRVVVTLNSNSTLTWNWATEVRYTRATNGNGAIAGSTNGWYLLDSSVSATGTPAVGYHFAGWEGDVPAAQTNENPLYLLMDRARTVIGRFAFDPGNFTGTVFLMQ
jgi:hypothetical protein